MKKMTLIEWAHFTINLWWGCTHVHAGCDHCYAEATDKRWSKGKPHWGNDAPRRYITSWEKELMDIQKAAKAAGTRYRVFVGSMMDIFEKPMDLVDIDGNKMMFDTGFIRTKFFQNIAAGYYPDIIFLLLTKRPSNIMKYIPQEWCADGSDGAPGNVWFGTSVVDQKSYNTLVPQLLRVPGKRFLSMEPLLADIEMMYPKEIYPDGPEHCCDGRECGCMGRPIDPPLLHGIDWVISGGESGPFARPPYPYWFKKISIACAELRIPHLFKQWGEWAPFNAMYDSPHLPDDKLDVLLQPKYPALWVFPDGSTKDKATMEEMDKAVLMYKTGKHIAGNKLNGKQYLDYPVFCCVFLLIPWYMAIAYIISGLILWGCILFYAIRKTRVKNYDDFIAERKKRQQ